ncbi:esterase [Brevibacillus reuszeri]|uniref:Esterase n=1 Tax=Brevibacillus reuszeri TaxID=54915 RepID=A0A0K9Z1D7_9BACL|nr:alpha/beta hydrolase [Brevibacillus reuszeri]KNB74761.1 lipase [Brevibacillus reuszeri]MED1859599.1 alpha/beta hydrolase [Brevibacillus reuszeri]GED71901.1 esterase [Brevibacillus reuszeri]
MEERVHPELRTMLSVMPEMNFDRENLVAMRNSMDDMFVGAPQNPNLSIADQFVLAADGEYQIPVRVYKPRVSNETLPGILYIHGGGYIVGSVKTFDATCQEIAADLASVVVSVDYRLAPEHPYPIPVEDCYSALLWFAANAEEMGVDPARIAVVGASAGGGLTAAVSLLARDRNGPVIAFQMPLYPMIDDRHITISSNEITDNRVWNTKFNRQGWEMYLGEQAGTEISPYAAPARATDFSRLPSTYTCIGDLDPFRDETIEFVRKLTEAHVPVEFHLYPGCFHGFELIVPNASISRQARQAYYEALKRALHNR